MISKQVQSEIDRQLHKLLERGGASGFQLSLGFRDQSIGCFCAGISDQDQSRRVHPRTWFDLASLTKIISTTTLTMFALQEKRLVEGLETPLRMFFPSFASDLKNKTIADLLNHRAGLPAVFEQTDVKEERDERIRFFLDQIDRDYKNLNCDYSDVGFMLLGLVLEKVFQNRLRTIFAETLGENNDLAYGPVAQSPFFVRWLGGRSVANQFKLESHEYLSPGTTQDPRAQWFHGDAGHSGLWGSAIGIELWAQQLFRAFHGKDLRLSDRTVRRFIDFDATRGRWLNGFDTPTPPSQSGTSFPATTIGHLGFTGASFWMDMESGARVSLLCHRFDEGIKPERLRELRPDFHDWLWANVFSKLST